MTGVDGMLEAARSSMRFGVSCLGVLSGICSAEGRRTRYLSRLLPVQSNVSTPSALIGLVPRSIRFHAVALSAMRESEKTDLEREPPAIFERDRFKFVRRYPAMQKIVS